MSWQRNVLDIFHVLNVVKIMIMLRYHTPGGGRQHQGRRLSSGNTDGGDHSHQDTSKPLGHLWKGSVGDDFQALRGCEHVGNLGGNIRKHEFSIVELGATVGTPDQKNHRRIPREAN